MKIHGQANSNIRNVIRYNHFKLPEKKRSAHNPQQVARNDESTRAPMLKPIRESTNCDTHTQIVPTLADPQFYNQFKHPQVLGRMHARSSAHAHTSKKANSNIHNYEGQVKYPQILKPTQTSTIDYKNLTTPQHAPTMVRPIQTPTC